jgi:hypothetical protein
VKHLLLLLVGSLVALTAALFALMHRRDEASLGVAGLATMMAAAIAALPYSALQDL